MRIHKMKLITQQLIVPLVLFWCIVGIAYTNGGREVVFNTGVQEDTEKQITIRLLTRFAGDGPTAPYFQAMQKEFVRRNPNVRFDDDSVKREASFNNRFKVGVATGNIPHMMNIFGSAGLVDYAKNGIFMDITPLFDDEEWYRGFKKNAFNQCDFSRYGVDGVYGLPFSLPPEVFYYNEELFKRAGIKATPETMRELYEIIDKLNAAGIVPIGCGAEDIWRPNHIHNHILYKYLGVQKAMELGTGEAQWTDPDVVETLRILQGFKERGAFEAGFAKVDVATEKKRFLEGKYAMVLNGDWFTGDIINSYSPYKESIKIFPFPSFESRPQFKDNHTVYSNMHQLNGKLTGVEREMTTKWAKFFHGRYAQTELVERAYRTPARHDVDIGTPSLNPITSAIFEYASTIKISGGDTFDYDPYRSFHGEFIRKAVMEMLLGRSPEETAEKIQQAKTD